MEVNRAPPRRLGLVLGVSGLALLFGPAVLFLLASTMPTIVLVGTMIVGIFLLVAGFVTVPRKR